MAISRDWGKYKNGTILTDAAQLSLKKRQTTVNYSFCEHE
jgi:hypothetical protein